MTDFTASFLDAGKEKSVSSPINTEKATYKINESTND